MAFKKGDTVYSGRGENLKEMVVAKRHDNPLLPVYQYSFDPPHDGFACGEQSIRATKNGKDKTMSECPKDGEDDYGGEMDTTIKTIFNTMASGLRHPIMMDRLEGGIDVGDMFSDSDIFFRPDLKFVEWLKDHANGRLIVDVGAGQGHLVTMLKRVGAKAIGLEPNLNFQEWVKWRSYRDKDMPDVNEMLPRTIQESKDLINGMGAENVMLVFARPCHSNFVYDGIYNMSEGMEALYITLKENLNYYDDLGGFRDDAVLLDHEGISEDNEVVYSIKR